MWDLQTEKYDRELPTDSQWIGMSADGQRWAEKAASGEVAVYELGKPEPVFRLNAAHSGSVHRLSEDGKTFVVGQPNRLSIHRIDYPAAILEEYETKVADPIGAVWIPGDQIAIWDALGKMSVMPSPALVTGYFLNEIPVETVEYTQSHNRRTLVFRGLTGPAVLYDTKTLQIARLKLASGRTKGVASSRLGDRHIVWDETGGGLFELKSLAGKKSPMDLSPEVTVAVTATIRSAGFSQNSAVLYVLGEDDQLSFSWLDKTATRVIVEGVKQVVQGDDNTLAVVFTDGSVRLYDAQFGVPLSDPLPTSGKVTLAAFGRPAPPSLAPSQLPMTTAALFQVPVSPSKGDLSKQPKVSPKQSAAPEYDEKGKAADPKRPVVTPESPLEKGADPTQAEPAAAPIPPAPEPDTRQALSLVTEEGNIEVWELNNSGRAVAMILVGDVQGSLDLTPAAKELSTVLTSRFGFEVTFLGSPIKADVLKEWNRLQTELSPSDRFLFVLIGNSEVMNGETQTNNDDLLFQIGGERKDWITGEQITSFLDALPASQVLMIADCAKAGTLIADSSLMPTKSDQTASRLVLSASGTDDYPWRLTGQELQSKLLTPVVQILQESPLRFQSYPELKAPGLPSDLFTAEEGFNRLAPFIASANERIRTDNPNGILQNGKRLKTDGPIVYGPLRGSKHTPGAQFYFPRRRPPPMTPLPVSTKAERPAEKLNEKK